MKIIIILILLSNLLFPVGGVIVFNDGTTIEGDVTNVNASSIYITPMGLTFPEQIRMENVDSLKLDDGKLLIANNRALLLLDNGQFYEPGLVQNEDDVRDEKYDIEYVLAPNWSVNSYLGYPLIKSESLSDKYYDKVSPIFGLSIGSPYGIFLENFYVNGIFELAYYNFSKQSGEVSPQFDGLAIQIGVSPGFFIGETSVSFTACTGIYHAGGGFIGGGSLDIPLVESIEMRITSRANIVQKEEGGSTYWIDAGISLGYEF